MQHSEQDVSESQKLNNIFDEKSVDVQLVGICKRNLARIFRRLCHSELMLFGLQVVPDGVDFSMR